MASVAGDGVFLGAVAGGNISWWLSLALWLHDNAARDDDVGSNGEVGVGGDGDEGGGIFDAYNSVEGVGLQSRR